MKRLILSTMLFMLFLPMLAYSTDSDTSTNIDINSIHKWECECRFDAGTVSTNDEAGRTDCGVIVANLEGEETAVSQVELDANANRYICWAIHYVYGFGNSYRKAINNANLTCRVIAVSHSRDFSMLPGLCRIIP